MIVAICESTGLAVQTNVNRGVLQVVRPYCEVHSPEVQHIFYLPMSHISPTAEH